MELSVTNDFFVFVYVLVLAWEALPHCWLQCRVRRVGLAAAPGYPHGGVGIPGPSLLGAAAPLGGAQPLPARGGQGSTLEDSPDFRPSVHGR